MKWDQYGNMYYENPKINPTATPSNVPAPIASGELLKIRPNENWIRLIDKDLQPQFLTLFAQLFLKVNEPEEAFPYIENLSNEHPETGDLARLGSPISGNFSHYFVQQNIGKKCISLDLNKDEGREIVRKLCVEADIIAENFRPGTLGAFDLDYDSIKLLNKKAVYVSISGYGQHGPLRGRAAFAPTVHAECGTAHTKFKHIGTALDDFSNMQSDFSHADVYTGLEAAVSYCCYTWYFYFFYDIY